MDEPEKQFRDFYQDKSMSSERLADVLAEGRRLAEEHNRRKLFWRTASIAAGLAVVGCVGWLALSKQTSGPQTPTIAEAQIPSGITLPALQEEVVAFFSDPDYELDQISLNQSELLAYLKEQGAPGEIAIPAGIEALDNLGCEVLSIDGQQVYIMCFYLDGVPRDADGVAMPGKKPMMAGAPPEAAPSDPVANSDAPPPMMKKPAALVHLVTIPRDQFQGAPAVGDPVSISQEGMWGFATWAVGDVVYVAASPAEAERFAALAAELQS
ncbi:MAG: hypothetical protein SynsKO_19120 [Synoicihabitans sp.]